MLSMVLNFRWICKQGSYKVHTKKFEADLLPKKEDLILISRVCLKLIFFFFLSLQIAAFIKATLIWLR